MNPSVGSNPTLSASSWQHFANYVTQITRVEFAFA
jgi:hypothetical protein